MHKFRQVCQPVSSSGGDSEAVQQSSTDGVGSQSGGIVTDQSSEESSAACDDQGKRYTCLDGGGYEVADCQYECARWCLLLKLADCSHVCSLTHQHYTSSLAGLHTLQCTGLFHARHVMIKLRLLGYPGYKMQF